MWESVRGSGAADDRLRKEGRVSGGLAGFYIVDRVKGG